MSTASSPETASRQNHNKRLRTGLLLGAGFVLVAYLGGWFWFVLGIILFWLALKELELMMKSKDFHPSSAIVLVFGIGIFLLAFCGRTDWMLPTLTLGVVAGFFRLLFRQPRSSIGDIGATFFALFYVGFLPAHLVLLRNIGSFSKELHDPQIGFFYFLLVAMIISASDVGAYYFGKRYGKTLLYPELSPKKTREGALAGWACAFIIGLTFSWIIHFPLHHAFFLVVFLVPVAQLGDLVESLIKRDAGVKDSGMIFEGHGGVLDRLDSYIFSGAVAFYYIHWLVLKQGLMQEVLRQLPRLNQFL